MTHSLWVNVSGMHADDSWRKKADDPFGSDMAILSACFLVRSRAKCKMIGDLVASKAYLESNPMFRGELAMLLLKVCDKLCCYVCMGMHRVKHCCCLQMTQALGGDMDESVADTTALALMKDPKVRFVKFHPLVGDEAFSSTPSLSGAVGGTGSVVEAVPAMGDLASPGSNGTHGMVASAPTSDPSPPSAPSGRPAPPAPSPLEDESGRKYVEVGGIRFYAPS